jgi:hypothetical protein
MKPKAVFISNKIYLDSNSAKGGAGICTQEYIDLLSTRFDLFLFSVTNRKSFIYRILARLGLNIYSDFDYCDYQDDLELLINEKQIGFVFLNQANTAVFGAGIKSLCGNNISVILCSHGNESGDLLHDFTRHKETQPKFKQLLNNWILGKTLVTEVKHRNGAFDGVITVSEVEVQIENWLGARKVLLMPRTIKYRNSDFNETLGVVGFVGDLSHPPNYSGLKLVCEELSKMDKANEIELRIVSSSKNEGLMLEAEFLFVKYLGYLTDNEIFDESRSWSFFLNPVFYYSRGVSTKLAWALGLGIPVITTEIGKRGYVWTNGELPLVKTPCEMASVICHYSRDIKKIYFYREQVVEIVNSGPNMDDLSLKLKEFLYK